MENEKIEDENFLEEAIGKDQVKWALDYLVDSLSEENLDTEKLKAEVIEIMNKQCKVLHNIYPWFKYFQEPKSLEDFSKYPKLLDFMTSKENEVTFQIATTVSEFFVLNYDCNPVNLGFRWDYDKPENYSNRSLVIFFDKDKFPKFGEYLKERGMSPGKEINLNTLKNANFFLMDLLWKIVLGHYVEMNCQEVKIFIYENLNIYTLPKNKDFIAEMGIYYDSGLWGLERFKNEKGAF